MTEGPVILVGAMDALRRRPDFLVPLYSAQMQGNLLYFQQVNAANQIVSFLPYERGSIDIDLSPAGQVRSIGEGEMICFAFDQTDIHVGSPDLFSVALHDLPHDERLKPYPVTRALLAEYCRNPDALATALEEAYLAFSKVSVESARAFRDDFSLTRVCRSALARAAGMLSAPVETYPALRQVRAGVHSTKVIVEIGTPELTEVRHSSGLEAAVQSALRPYLQAFKTSDRVEFRYADYKAAQPPQLTEVKEASERIRIFSAGPTISGLFERNFTRPRPARDDALPTAVSDFSSMFPYRADFDVDPTNIIFFAPFEADTLFELLADFDPIDRNIGVVLAEQVKGPEDFQRLSKIKDVLAGLAIVHRRPIWRSGSFATPTIFKTIQQFLRVFGQVVLERPRQAPPTSFVFSQAYLTGGIRNLDEAVTHCISAGVGTFAPLSEADGANVVVTSQAKLTAAHVWQGTSTIRRYLRVSDDDVVVRGWRIPFDPYSSSASVAFVAEVPDRASFLQSNLQSEIDLILRTTSQSADYRKEDGSGLIHVTKQRAEFTIGADHIDPRSSGLAPHVYVIENVYDGRTRPWLGDDVCVVPLQDLHLVLLADDPLRVARFIDYQTRRGPADWIFAEASEAIRSEVSYSPFTNRADGLPYSAAAFQFQDARFDYSRPRLRRNYEIGVTGKVAGMLRADETVESNREVALTFTVVLRPLGGSRISRLELDD